MMKTCTSIGSEQGQPEQVTADDVREVQQHRNDEGERQHKLNDPGEPVQSFVNHRHHRRIASGQ
jgi:hypothetical protein